MQGSAVWLPPPSLLEKHRDIDCLHMALIFHLLGYKIMSLVFPPWMKGLFNLSMSVSIFYECQIERNSIDKSTNMGIVKIWTIYNPRGDLPYWRSVVLTLRPLFCLFCPEVDWHRSATCFSSAVYVFSPAPAALQNIPACWGNRQKHHNLRPTTAPHSPCNSSYPPPPPLDNRAKKNVFIEWMFQRLHRVIPHASTTTTPIKRLSSQ